MDLSIVICIVVIIIVLGAIVGFSIFSKSVVNSSLEKIDTSKTGKSQWYKDLKTNGRITTDPKEMDKNGIRIILERDDQKHAYAIIRDADLSYQRINYDMETKRQKLGISEPELSSFQTADVHYKYHPSEYVYTGVTVGGVSTGSVKDVGNYYSKSMTDNGGYAIACKHILDSKDFNEYKNKTKFVVYGMYVSSSLIDSAKRNNTLGQLLKKGTENYFVFFRPTRWAKEDLDIMGMADFSTRQELLNKSRRNAYLSKAECNDIIKWINSSK